MMPSASMFLAGSLLAILAAGIVMICRVHGPVNRLLVILMMGTMGVALLVVLAKAFSSTALLDVALVFAVLAVITCLAFVRLAWPTQAREGEGADYDR